MGCCCTSDSREGQMKLSFVRSGPPDGEDGRGQSLRHPDER